MYPIVKVFYKSVENGSQTLIMLSIEPQLEKTTGKFFAKCAEKEMSAKAKDDELGQWLWSHSENLTKLKV